MQLAIRLSSAVEHIQRLLDVILVGEFIEGQQDLAVLVDDECLQKNTAPITKAWTQKAARQRKVAKTETAGPAKQRDEYFVRR